MDPLDLSGIPNHRKKGGVGSPPGARVLGASEGLTGKLRYEGKWAMPHRRWAQGNHNNRGAPGDQQVQDQGRKG